MSQAGSGIPRNIALRSRACRVSGGRSTQRDVHDIESLNCGGQTAPFRLAFAPVRRRVFSNRPMRPVARDGPCCACRAFNAESVWSQQRHGCDVVTGGGIEKEVIGRATADGYKIVSTCQAKPVVLSVVSLMRSKAPSSVRRRSDKTESSTPVFSTRRASYMPS